MRSVIRRDVPSKVTLVPGKQGEIVWQFAKAGTVNFACLMLGHYEAGMKGAVKMAKKKSTFLLSFLRKS